MKEATVGSSTLAYVLLEGILKMRISRRSN